MKNIFIIPIIGMMFFNQCIATQSLLAEKGEIIKVRTELESLREKRELKWQAKKITRLCSDFSKVEGLADGRELTAADYYGIACIVSQSREFIPIEPEMETKYLILSASKGNIAAMYTLANLGIYDDQSEEALKNIQSGGYFQTFDGFFDFQEILEEELNGINDSEAFDCAIARLKAEKGTPGAEGQLLADSSLPDNLSIGDATQWSHPAADPDNPMITPTSSTSSLSSYPMNSMSLSADSTHSVNSYASEPLSTASNSTGSVGTSSPAPFFSYSQNATPTHNRSGLGKPEDAVRRSQSSPPPHSSDSEE